MVDAYKNLLMQKGAKPNQKIIVGCQSSTVQIALVLAAVELALTIVIIGTPYLNNSTRSGINPKFKAILPVDFFVCNHHGETDKLDAFSQTCGTTIILSQETLDYTPNSAILANGESVLMQSTSSGTTGTAKLINHTHEFMTKLVLRNSKQYSGTMGMLSNLAHGSSPAAYFLPGLVSSNVTDYYNLPNLPGDQIGEMIAQHAIDVNHLLFPYTHMLDEFFDSPWNLPNCTLYTLGIVKEAWTVYAVSKNRVKDIVSIFGSSETSGPIFINRATMSPFAENRYVLVDDFYQVDLDDHEKLVVRMPVYNTSLKPNDKFKKQRSEYFHMGRSDLLRVNDLEVEVSYYQSVLASMFKADIIVDSEKNSIYLAVWDQDTDISLVPELDSVIRKRSDNMHGITQYAVLDRNDYLNGIKVDFEMLRCYFREITQRQ